MRKILTLCVAILCAVMLLGACAPQVYRPQKHRRDRNCGCENRLPVTTSPEQSQLLTLNGE